MKAISKDAQKRLPDLCAEFTIIQADLAKAAEALRAEYEALNAKRQEIAEILEDEANEAEAYHDEKSERWQESERGEAFAEWRDELRRIADAVGEEIEPPEIDFDSPEWLGEVEEQTFAEFPY